MAATITGLDAAVDTVAAVNTTHYFGIMPTVLHGWRRFQMGRTVDSPNGGAGSGTARFFVAFGLAIVNVDGEVC
jgi:hypothetical protein